MAEHTSEMSRTEGANATKAQQPAGARGTPGKVTRTSRMRTGGASAGLGAVQRKESGAAGEVRELLSGNSESSASAALSNLPSGGGAPVSATIMRKVESATGQAAGDARVHTGEASARAAHALSARAFAIGSDIHLGAGESASDTSLMAHEVAHTMQQSSGAKLEAGVSQPGDALELEADRVAEAAVSGGRAELSGRGRGAIMRDAVSDVEELLSYGVFDWAVTDSDAAQVFRIICALPPGGQATLTTSLGATFRNRLSSNLQRVATIGPNEHAVLRVLFDNTPAAEVDTLQNWVALRFNLTVGASSGGGEAWDKTGLRRCWDVLQTLPPSHVENNRDLSSLTRYRSGSIEGWASSDGEAAMGYGNQRDSIDTALETGAYTDAADPLRGKNLFDATVRHEIGHRVDDQVGGPAYCATDPGGAWLTWDDPSGMAAIMVTASAGAVSTWSDAAQKTAIIECLQGVIDDQAPSEIETRLEALPFCAPSGDANATHVANLTAIKGDRAVRALRVAFSQSGPWSSANGGVKLGERIYHESYAWGQWVSYKQEARTRKVSKYQFRAPGEWFAEAYAAYYQPPGEKGALLAGRDDATKAWFDANVDPQNGAGGTLPPGAAAGAAAGAAGAAGAAAGAAGPAATGGTGGAP
ncbi:DUF4157 domain-containing protein [Haliangium ochraceum]|uniref:eCIS core domain-containing protein n=1 Tax=Haliangium ochraceum (strain DSM 14365 / JCM 11303 / SMP-2) TaxID=502025 RepID=D0LLZ2_HALO1|nr:DUF4157 domain-containing protein [Haliangium ochraceum]ACY15170.1 hypothetical protein Hoch_2638 [Haliangium ochraceum DSM 14365]